MAGELLAAFTQYRLRREQHKLYAGAGGPADIVLRASGLADEERLVARRHLDLRRYRRRDDLVGARTIAERGGENRSA